ncbi:hypothetical protein OAN22_01240 [Alphaproteobacteria bacterium]|nr:hypothetical protein [Alphaproteobacteria bacterium]
MLFRRLLFLLCVFSSTLSFGVTEGNDNFTDQSSLWFHNQVNRAGVWAWGDRWPTCRQIKAAIDPKQAEVVCLPEDELRRRLERDHVAREFVGGADFFRYHSKPNFFEAIAGRRVTVGDICTSLRRAEERIQVCDNFSWFDILNATAPGAPLSFMSYSGYFGGINTTREEYREQLGRAMVVLLSDVPNADKAFIDEQANPVKLWKELAVEE